MIKPVDDVLKITIITAVYNRVKTIAESVNSVKQQTYSYVEHIVVDGASDDGTLSVVQGLAVDVKDFILISEPDNGLYDAINKGFSLSTGDVIGLMHSDDYFADDRVLESVAEAFVDETVDAVYGDLVYVANDDTTCVIRNWIAGEYHPTKIKRGWMPPHPTLFIRRHVIESLGGFDTRYRISADYDAILRYYNQGKIFSKYIPRVLVKMRTGGISNNSIGKIFQKTKEDYLALRRNHVGGLWALTCKNLSKVQQYYKHL